ncbi:MAG: DinB family protein [Treponema sp.]|jgi:uncharacterized damage-inducible protein DinB|nr:DinB family protein [Treponema sp.]
MEKEIFELLARYNKSVNTKMNDIIKCISEEEWNKQFSGFYKSIHELCSHIFIADYTWLKRFGESNDFKVLNIKYFNKNYSFREILFDNISEYVKMREELDAILLDFIKEMTGNDLVKMVKWTTLKGITFEKNIGICLMHLFNHETHHRGMASLYLDMMGKENDYSMVYPYG